MEIVTPRLTLRPLGPEYLETTHAYASDRAHTRYMLFLPNETVGETRAFLEACAAQWAGPEPEYYEFAILLDGAHIGAVSLYPEDGWAELGWILAPAHQGHGYAVEAAQAMIDWAAGQLGRRRFIAHCDAENLASQRVMGKLGMRRIGVAGGRRNRCSDAPRTEYTYELVIPSDASPR